MPSDRSNVVGLISFDDGTSIHDLFHADPKLSAASRLQPQLSRLSRVTPVIVLRANLDSLYAELEAEVAAFNRRFQSAVDAGA